MKNVLDLFAGIGGFSLGLEKTRFYKTCAFAEIDVKAQAVLARHWPDVPKFDDVKGVNRATFIQCGIPLPDLICGGFPCQDISAAGRGAGLDGARSSLWWEFHRIIEEFQPAWAIIENVSVLRRRGLDRVLGSLAEIGYDAEWNCVPASALGAPHQRDRIWIVAYPHGNPVREQSGRCSGSLGQGASVTGAAGQGESADADGERCTLCGAPRQLIGQDECGYQPDRLGAGLPDDGTEPSCSVAYAERITGQREGASETGAGRGAVRAGEAQSGRCGCAVADAYGPRLEGWLRAILQHRAAQRAAWTGDPSEAAYLGSTGQWLVEPAVGRVVDGFPGRVDSLRQLGNAIVPTHAEILGEAIWLYENFGVFQDNASMRSWIL